MFHHLGSSYLIHCRISPKPSYHLISTNIVTYLMTSNYINHMLKKKLPYLSSPYINHMLKKKTTPNSFLFSVPRIPPAPCDVATQRGNQWHRIVGRSSEKWSQYVTMSTPKLWVVFLKEILENNHGQPHMEVNLPKKNHLVNGWWYLGSWRKLLNNTWGFPF